jgi:alpha-beta hydrolase superfamily lysophospholipase
MDERLKRLCHVVVGSLLVAALPVLAPPPSIAQTSFYQPSPADLRGRPGTLIRQEPMPTAPPGASAYRVLYRSTGLKGEPIAVSGVVIVPSQPPVSGHRPIVAWAHPTSGIVPHCAPSLARNFYRQVQGLQEMLREGYVVTATDYPGLGTAGPHPYLVGASEGRAVLDSVRAARSLVGADASQGFAVWGHSQGGQAAFFAAGLARSYAPELSLVGVAAAAPATDLKTLLLDDLNTSGGDNILAMTLWSWSRVFKASLSGIVDPSALPLMDDLAGDCLESVVDILPRQRIGEALMQRFLLVDDVTERQPWRRLLAENDVPALPRGMPVFLSQGTADTTVRADVTLAYMGRLCASRNPVRMLLLSDVGHAFVARDSASAAVEWIASRFAGQPPPSDC